jgi:hypothetical protein
MYPINVSFKDILRIGTADSSFSLICTGLVHDYVHVFLQVFVHSFLSFTTPQFLSNTGLWTCLGHQSAVLFEYGSTHLCCSPLRQSFIGSPVLISFLSRVHGPVLYTVSHFLRSHITRCSSVPSRRTMCVGGAVCNDLVKQLHYTAISDIMSTSCDLCSSVIRLALRGSTDVLYLVI